MWARRAGQADARPGSPKKRGSRLLFGDVARAVRGLSGSSKAAPPSRKRASRSSTAARSKPFAPRSRQRLKKEKGGSSGFLHSCPRFVVAGPPPCPRSRSPRRSEGAGVADCCCASASQAVNKHRAARSPPSDPPRRHPSTRRTGTEQQVPSRVYTKARLGGSCPRVCVSRCPRLEGAQEGGLRHPTASPSSSIA
ncbi:hypothetical protein MRX96_017824 [Rhipicephalus microplus]